MQAVHISQTSQPTTAGSLRLEANPVVPFRVVETKATSILVEAGTPVDDSMLLVAVDNLQTGVSRVVLVDSAKAGVLPS